MKYYIFITNCNECILNTYFDRDIVINHIGSFIDKLFDEDIVQIYKGSKQIMNTTVAELKKVNVSKVIEILDEE